MDMTITSGPGMTQKHWWRFGPFSLNISILILFGWTLRFTLLQLQDMYPQQWFRQLQHSWSAAMWHAEMLFLPQHLNNFAAVLIVSMIYVAYLFLSVFGPLFRFLVNTHSSIIIYPSSSLDHQTAFVLPLLSQSILKLSKNLGDIWADTKHSSKCSAQYYEWRS